MVIKSLLLLVIIILKQFSRSQKNDSKYRDGALLTIFSSQIEVTLSFVPFTGCINYRSLSSRLIKHYFRLQSIFSAACGPVLARHDSTIITPLWQVYVWRCCGRNSWRVNHVLKTRGPLMHRRPKLITWTRTWLLLASGVVLQTVIYKVLYGM